MASSRAAEKVRLSVKQVLANGDERCELRWPPAVDPIYSAVKDWSLVRDARFEVDPATGEAVLSFTRRGAAKVRQLNSEERASRKRRGTGARDTATGRREAGAEPGSG